jgi:DNA-binding winged helix-turn-helix (wHTH) protein
VVEEDHFREVSFRPGVKTMNMEFQLAEGKAAAGNASRFPTRYVRFGAFQLDVKRQDLLKNGARLRLPGKVYQVLITLLERPGEIVTREELRARLWPSDTHVNFDANVNTTVNKLRQVLGDSNEESAYVQTIPRRGYSFISKVEFVEQPEMAEIARAEGELSEENSSVLGEAARSKLFAAHSAKVWFTAWVIALVVAAMLLGAAITLYSHRAF